MAITILALVSCVSASSVRVATLGNDSRLLLDSSNLLYYPALVRQLAHANVELFDDWAGIAVPVGERHGAALFLNRPDDHQQELSAYIQNTGSALLRSLQPRPWLDVIYGLQVRSGLSLGVGLRYDYDVRDRGAEEASVSRWDGRFGLAIGARNWGLDGTLALQRTALRDRSDERLRQGSDGNGFSFDFRGRWAPSDNAILLPSILWQRTEFGLHPDTREQQELRGAVSLNLRPAQNLMGVVGVVVARRWGRNDIADDGLRASEHRHWLLPAIIAGGEIQLGGLQFRLGARHESVVEEVEGPAGVDLSFAGGLVTDVGVGMEFGAVVIDGMLEKNFLRDGPHFVGGSSRGGGLLTTLSMMYRFYH